MYIMQPYDDALENILKNGSRQSNRTGVDTFTVFGIQSRYKIDKYFPLLTGRKIWPKAIWAELLWFISGSSNNKDLQALGSNIWTRWVDKEFEQENGYIEGALGPVYGFQLRHFGGFYGNGEREQEQEISHERESDKSFIRRYGEGGVDQLECMINTLKKDPNSRRNLFSLWNPKDLGKQRLPCCHYAFQVYVNDGKLSGHLTQRSCDFAIGVPANVQFYSTLIYMLAQQTGYVPYEFIHSTVNAHIYENQIDGVKQYLSRDKPHSPTLEIVKADNIYSYNMDYFLLYNYSPLSTIKMEVTV